MGKLQTSKQIQKGGIKLMKSPTKIGGYSYYLQVGKESKISHNVYIYQMDSSVQDKQT